MRRCCFSLREGEVEAIDRIASFAGCLNGNGETNRSEAVRLSIACSERLIGILEGVPVPKSISGLDGRVLFLYRMSVLADDFGKREEGERDVKHPHR